MPHRGKPPSLRRPKIAKFSAPEPLPRLPTWHTGANRQPRQASRSPPAAIRDPPEAKNGPNYDFLVLTPTCSRKAAVHGRTIIARFTDASRRAPTPSVFPSASGASETPRSPLTLTVSSANRTLSRAVGGRSSKLCCWLDACRFAPERIIARRHPAKRPTARPRARASEPVRWATRARTAGHELSGCIESWRAMRAISAVDGSKCAEHARPVSRRDRGAPPEQRALPEPRGLCNPKGRSALQMRPVL